MLSYIYGIVIDVQNGVKKWLLKQSINVCFNGTTKRMAKYKKDHSSTATPVVRTRQIYYVYVLRLVTL